MFRITRYISRPGQDEPETRCSTIRDDELMDGEIVQIVTEGVKQKKKLSFIRIKSKSGREFDLINSEPLEICELVDDPHETPGETVPKKEKPNPQGEKDNAKLRLSRQ